MKQISKRRIIMPEMVLNIPIPDIASMINNMNNQEIETLYMFLTEQGSDLLERNKDLKSKKTDYLTEEEVFDV